MPSLTAAERSQVLYGFNRNAASYPEHALIHEIFEAQVKRAPAAVAVLYGDEQLTYEQLNLRANQVAHQLLQRGVRPDDRVCLYAERGVEEIVGLLGILKAGAAYVPLDPSYPHERINLMLEDSSPVAVLVQPNLLHQVANVRSSLLVLHEVSRGPTHNPVVPGLSSQNLAYVIYTSGSTGRPKGVMVEHRSVVRLVINSDYAPVSSKDCIPHCASPSFDATTWEVWATLLNGARLLIVPQTVVLEPEALNSLLVRYRATVLFLTVGLFHAYADTLESAFGILRYLITGGDVTNPACVRRALSKVISPQCVLNAYGPTETTTFATTFAMTAPPAGDVPLPIGRPITNTYVYILDDDAQPVPIGGVGEILIGGPGVARGYLNQPALTAERFVPDPFEKGGSARLYRTGDLGRWRPDGTIDFLGRNDLQVKIRGFRIEPEEVELVLRSQKGVKDAVVVAREDTPGAKRLVTYVVSDDPSSALSAEVLRDQLKAVFPEHMVPSAFVQLKSMPLTPNGKLDRRALPAPELGAYVSRQYEFPQGEIEEILAGIWQSLLRVERVGRQDNFFELGGDSLTVFKLTVGVEERLGIKLYANTVFRNPTFIDMGAAIQSELSVRRPGGSTKSSAELEHGVL